jgi:hypothetical protein
MFSVEWPMGKLQAPSSKLQKAPNPKHQNELLMTCKAANINQDRATRFPRGLWDLERGIFLELGNLELGASVSLPVVPLKLVRKMYLANAKSLASSHFDYSRWCEMSLPVGKQPKLAFLPEGQRGGTRFLETVRGRGARPRVTVAKVTFKTKPVS